jgi:flagellar biosynthesis/type III secretory pathway protein FliH
VLDFRFHVVQLNQLSWQDYLKHPNPAAAALMSRMRIAKADRPKVKLECLRMLVALKLDSRKSRTIAKFIDSYLQLTPEEEQAQEQQFLELNPQEAKQVKEIVTSWERRGLQKGLELGREQGREQGHQQGHEQGHEQGLATGLKRGLEQALQVLLESKFGNIPNQLRQRLEQIQDPLRLQSLLVEIPSCPSLAHFESMLP